MWDSFSEGGMGGGGPPLSAWAGLWPGGLWNGPVVRVVMAVALVVVGRVVLDFVRAYAVLRGRVRVPVYLWSPRIFKSVYGVSRRGLLESMLQRVNASRSSAAACRAGSRNANNPGGMFGTVVGNRAVVHVGDAEGASRVLRMQPTKGQLYGAFHAFAGRGIFTADGEEWREKRHAVVRALGAAGSAEQAEVINLEMDRLLDADDAGGLWADALVERGEEREGTTSCSTSALPRASEAPRAFEWAAVAQRLMLRINHRFLTGAVLDDRELERDYIREVTLLRYLLPARTRSVWMLSDALYYALSPLGARETGAIAVTHDLVRRSLKTCLPGSVLEKLSSGSLAHKQRTTDLRDEAQTLMFAGQDTQSATLAWALHLLASSPGALVKLKGEVSTLHARKGAHLSHGDVARCVYLDAVLKETLRLFPVAPLVLRELETDVAVSTGTIPAGTAVAVWLYCVHRSTDAWGPDAAEFRPERWLRQAGDADAQKGDPEKVGSTYTRRWIPFADGSPRSCVGARIAMANLKLCMARLVRDLDIAPDLDHSPADVKDACRPSTGFTIMPASGTPLLLRSI